MTITDTSANPLAVIGTVVFVFAVSPVIVIGNALLLASVRRFKRLRTPSNYLVASLAASDLAVGLALPFGIYIRITENAHCLLIYCILISLCSASLIVMASIAVDRFMSLSQPLRYNDLITHKSILRCLPCLWIYSIVLGFTPAMFHGTLMIPLHLRHCSFPTLVEPEVQLLLLCSIYGPCCGTVLGCYAYTYAVARYHARAIYTVEVSVGSVKQLAVSRCGQTLAITVGCFLILWLPFQCCMLMDLMQGSELVACWRGVLLSLPIFLGSAINPWVYGFRNAEIRAAVYKLIEDMFGKIRVSACKGGTELTRNLDGAELNSFASHMRLYAESPHKTHLTPRHISPEKTAVLVVPEIHVEVVVTAKNLSERGGCSTAVSKHSHQFFI